MLRTVLCAALAASFACSSAAPTKAALPNTCSSDAECSAHFRCDAEQRRCVCSSDEACPGQFCSAFTGTCVTAVAGCTSDSGCTAGSYCDRAARTCKPVTPFCQPCKSDSQCGAGSACAAHPSFPGAGTFCVPTCQAPAGGGAPGCANGLTCKTTASGANLCFPATGACGQSNACVPDSLRICAADADCGDPDQACDQQLKACVARNRTCPSGDACDPQSKLCVHACGSDSDCLQIEHAPGYQCRANACFIRALCSRDSDCTAGQICQPNPDGSSSCHQGCVSASDCPLGQGCSTADPAHPRCTSGCTQDADCPANSTCINGACTQQTSSCNTQTCQDTQACGIGQTCISGCCSPLNFQAACPPNGACGTCAQTGCTSNSCDTSCYILNLANCQTLNDCTSKGYPAGVVCNSSLGKCQLKAQLQPCAGDGDCTAKGFRCVQNFGCGGGVCFPYEQAASNACALGHP